MPLIYNGIEIKKVIYNNVELDKLIYNNVEVFSASSPSPTPESPVEDDYLVYIYDTNLKGYIINNVKDVGDIYQEFVIPDNYNKIPVIGIKEKAFYGCTLLTQLTIPYTIINIGEYAFEGCVNLGTIICEAINPPSITETTFELVPEYCSIEVPMESVEAYKNAKYWSLRYKHISPITTPEKYFTFTLINNTYSIKAKDVNNIPNGILLPTIYNGKNITIVAKEAFRRSEVLNSIIIPDVYYKSIYEYAFSDCHYLNNITIGSAVNEIKANVFNNCTNLKSLTCKAINPPTIASSSTLKGLPADCIIYVPAENVEAYKKANYWKTRASYIQAIPS